MSLRHVPPVTSMKKRHIHAYQAHAFMTTAIRSALGALNQQLCCAKSMVIVSFSHVVKLCGPVLLISWSLGRQPNIQETKKHEIVVVCPTLVGYIV